VSPAPVAQFTPSALTVCESSSVTFTNTSSGTPVYSWSFGDGDTSTSVNPSHAFNSTGTFTVTLIAASGSCSDQAQVQIHVAPSPHAAFAASNICWGDSVVFTNQSVVSGSTIQTIQWIFGDLDSLTGIMSPSHYYNSAGTYTVSLYLENTDHCVDTEQHAITIWPQPVINFSANPSSACDTATVTFTNLSSGAITWHWMFGDGDTSNQQSPVHFFQHPGTYTVALTGTSNFGCSRSKAILNTVVVHASPHADFSASGTLLCKNDCIGFTDLSSGNPTSCNWTFTGGTPASASIHNPNQVCYSTAGDYDVTLTVSDAFCNSSTTHSSYIHIVNCSAPPVASFISSDTTFCSGSCISFSDLSQNAISWQWYFTGATPATSTQENPSGICYANAGNFPVKLIAINPSGTDTMEVIQLIHVDAAPAIPSFSQSGDTLTSSVAVSYQWYFNSLPISGATNRQYIATLSGQYSVMVTNASGCTAVSSKEYVSLVGIENPEADAFFSIYPNPASSKIFIELKQSGKFNFKLLDVLGQTVFFRNSLTRQANERIEINLEDYLPGVYFLRIESDQRRFIRAFIKE